jgi:hypothetical protein
MFFQLTGGFLMNKRRCFLVVLMAGALLSASATGAWAAQKKKSTATDEAMKVLLRMAEFISKMPQFSVTLESGYEVIQQSGQSIEFGGVSKHTVLRPDRMHADFLRSDGRLAQFYFNGKALSFADQGEKVYASIERPGDIDEAIRFYVSDLHMRFPLAALFVTRTPELMRQRVTEAAIVEECGLTDVPTIHIAARTKDVDFQVWVPKEGDPLPRRVVISYKKEAAAPMFWANFRNWDLSPDTSDALFTFMPPQGFEQIRFLEEFRTMLKPATAKAKGSGKKGGVK